MKIRMRNYIKNVMKTGMMFRTLTGLPMYLGSCCIVCCSISGGGLYYGHKL
ncbi:hypothetical protein LY28_00681 [Ruminiclostridium sufflavum DSM 19573]|uniref:Uncharacterized protein n=1 Tax=Ruminiclostridium sufflavum DSM 19573 TaxID=1121337 RepID=A0A318XN85_9FIRM|nr:hypothetical protein LY28_00681 [Ruminiclostridium sufflavum DSM 19573]